MQMKRETFMIQWASYLHTAFFFWLISKFLNTTDSEYSGLLTPRPPCVEMTKSGHLPHYTLVINTMVFNTMVSSHPSLKESFKEESWEEDWNVRHVCAVILFFFEVSAFMQICSSKSVESELSCVESDLLYHQAQRVTEARASDLLLIKTNAFKWNTTTITLESHPLTDAC